MERELRDQLLRLLENNSKLSSQDLAVMLGATVEEVANEISVLEQEHVICGYHTLIDWNKINDDVTALVELRVTPQGGDGYQKLAERIKEFPQVVTLYLMSGAYDFLVSGKLASIHEVQNTTTHFTLTKYKEFGVDFEVEKVDERMVVTP